MSTHKKADHLFPFRTSPLNYSVGDHVKLVGSGSHREPSAVGIVTHLLPKTYKLNVQWPYGNEQLSPEEVYKVNPEQFPASVSYDDAYDSVENRRSEENYGEIPSRPKKSSVDRIIFRHLDKVEKIEQHVEGLKEKRASSLEAYIKTSSNLRAEVGDSLIKEVVDSVYGKK